MMPPGLPVATVGINGAANAGHLAAQILSASPDGLQMLISTPRFSATPGWMASTGGWGSR